MNGRIQAALAAVKRAGGTAVLYGSISTGKTVLLYRTHSTVGAVAVVGSTTSQTSFGALGAANREITVQGRVGGQTVSYFGRPVGVSIAKIDASVPGAVIVTVQHLRGQSQFKLGSVILDEHGWTVIGYTGAKRLLFHASSDGKVPSGVCQIQSSVHTSLRQCSSGIGV